jgi:hypothetical protein
MGDPSHTQLCGDTALQPFLDAALETAAAVTSTSADVSAGNGSSSSAAAATTARALVAKVLSQPDVVCGYDQIKQVLGEALGKLSATSSDGGGGADRVLRTLDLFSYGTLEDYRSAPPGTYLELTDAQIRKLRQLTVLTLVERACEQRKGSLGYDQVQQALQLETENPSNRSGSISESSNEVVEDILISCIYGRMLQGQLCQKSRRLLLVSQPHHQGPLLVSRDVHPATRVPELLDAVHRLQESVEVARRELRSDRDRVRSELMQSHVKAKQQQQRIKKARDLASGRVAQSALTWGLGGIGGGADGDPDSVASLAAVAAAVATGQDPAVAGTTSGSHRQKRSRGGIGGMAESTFGGRFM